jgi:hypothetical protein
VDTDPSFQGVLSGAIMSLIRCPECGRGVSDTATECPGCTFLLKPTAVPPPSTGGSRGIQKKWVWLALVPIILLTVGVVIASIASRTRHTFVVSPLPPSQREAAQDFWDTVVVQYTKGGLIAHYEPRADRLVMYVRAPLWRLLSLEDKRAFLANLSKTNEILGRPRHVEIRDQDSGKLYGLTQVPEKNEVYE